MEHLNQEEASGTWQVDLWFQAQMVNQVQRSWDLWEEVLGGVRDDETQESKVDLAVVVDLNSGLQVEVRKMMTQFELHCGSSSHRLQAVEFLVQQIGISTNVPSSLLLFHI